MAAAAAYARAAGAARRAARPWGSTSGSSACERALARARARPSGGLPAVQIAGTNGKGSTAAMTEAILRAAGPGARPLHLAAPVPLHRAHPRSPASRSTAIAWLRLDAAVAATGVPLTYFEVATVLGVSGHGRGGVELGGAGDRARRAARRGDHVRAAGHGDHQHRLGPHRITSARRLASIAREKAGILKPGVPRFLARAARRGRRGDRRRWRARVGAPLLRLGRDFDIAPDCRRRRWRARTSAPTRPWRWRWRARPARRQGRALPADADRARARRRALAGAARARATRPVRCCSTARTTPRARRRWRRRCRRSRARRRRGAGDLGRRRARIWPACCGRLLPLVSRGDRDPLAQSARVAAGRARGGDRGVLARGGRKAPRTHVIDDARDAIAEARRLAGSTAVWWWSRDRSSWPPRRAPRCSASASTRSRFRSAVSAPDGSNCQGAKTRVRTSKAGLQSPLQEVRTLYCPDLGVLASWRFIHPNVGRARTNTPRSCVRARLLCRYKARRRLQ